jgi:hypothetical protein
MLRGARNCQAKERREEETEVLGGLSLYVRGLAIATEGLHLVVYTP